MSRRNYTREILTSLSYGPMVAVVTVGARDCIVAYRPRNAHDPRPWAAEGHRYSGREVHTVWV